MIDPTADELAEIEREMVEAMEQLMATCTCPEKLHDDEAECPVSPACSCGPVYFNPFCARHGDPSYP